MSHLPYMKFFPSNWRSDLELRLCGPAARGIWVDLLCIAHCADPIGYVKISGRNPTMTELAKAIGDPLDVVIAAIAELETNHVFSRTKAGVIYCRKMVFDSNRARISVENGKKGGNPTLLNQRQNPARDNQQDKLILESRVQSIEVETLADGKESIGEVEIRGTESKLLTRGVRAAKPRGTRLPDDWVLPKAWGQWAVERGMIRAAVLLEAENFHDYWCSKSGASATKVKWQLTWQTWIRKVIAEAGTKKRNGTRYGQFESADAKLEAWGIHDAKPYRPEPKPRDRCAKAAAGTPDLPGMQPLEDADSSEDQVPFRDYDA